MSEIVTAEKMAKRIGVKKNTLLAWARKGRVPCLRASKRPVLFDAEEVFQAMRKNVLPIEV